MRLWVLFTGLIGSDQFLPLDGRYSVTTACRKAREHLARLRKHLYPNLATGFQVCRGQNLRCYDIIHTEKSA